MEDLKSSKKTGSSYKHTFPVHTKTIPSPLSKEAPPESYRGFVNLGSKFPTLNLAVQLRFSSGSEEVCPSALVLVQDRHACMHQGDTISRKQDDTAIVSSSNTCQDVNLQPEVDNHV